jgi:hypothetical protein
MGLGTRTKAWRFTDINKDYTVSRLLESRDVLGRVGRTGFLAVSETSVSSAPPILRFSLSQLALVTRLSRTRPNIGARLGYLRFRICTGETL